MGTISTTKKRDGYLKEKIIGYATRKNHDGPIEHSVEIALETIEGLLHDRYPLSRRAIGLLLLQEDHEIQEIVKGKPADDYKPLEKIFPE